MMLLLLILQPILIKKTKAGRSPVAKKVQEKDRDIAAEIASLDNETDNLLKREQIQQMKGKVMQLRKEVGKPVPGAAGKKRTVSESEKNVEKLMTEVSSIIWYILEESCKFPIGIEIG